MTFFDTHFHLPGILAKGIAIDQLGHPEGMDIGCEPGDIAHRSPLLANFPGLFHSVAAGPHHVPRGGIIHCFSSDMAAAQAFLELGYHISFAGNVTYRSNVKLVEALKTVPLDRLLLETDSPYLAPVPVRGRVNTPLNISYTYEFVAAVKGVDVESLDATVRENFYSIIR